MSQYKAASGLTAAIEQGALAVTWNGSNGSELRARYGIDNGQPVVRELAVRKSGGQWAPLGQNLVPEFYVKIGRSPHDDAAGRAAEQSGRRHHAGGDREEQMVRVLGCAVRHSGRAGARTGESGRARLAAADNPDPLRRASRRRRRGSVPPGPEGRVYGLPRKPEEIRSADAKFQTSSCSVNTDGARVEVNFPGLSMGIFSGSLRFTSYRGSNLLRMEAIAKTDEQSVAYKYEGGLKGFSTALTPRVTWRDRGGDPQQYEFGGLKNDTRVTVKAKNRVLVAGGGKSGSIATFTPPHVFFFTREVDTNLGYIWYRKDGDTQFGMGIRQAEGEEEPQYVENFALHNAPPGTMQRMAVYYLITPDTAEATRQAVMAYTHGDVFKPVPGYKTMVNHFHLRFTERLRASGSLDNTFEDLMVMRSTGINIVGLSDFHGDLRPNDPGAGPVRRSARLLRGDPEGVRQGLPGDQLGRADRVLRRALQRHVPEERVLVEGAQRRAAVHRDDAAIRQGVPHGQHDDRARLLEADRSLATGLPRRVDAHRRHLRLRRRRLLHLHRPRGDMLKSGGIWVCPTEVETRSWSTRPWLRPPSWACPTSTAWTSRWPSSPSPDAVSDEDTSSPSAARASLTSNAPQRGLRGRAAQDRDRRAPAVQGPSPAGQQLHKG